MTAAASDNEPVLTGLQEAGTPSGGRSRKSRDPAKTDHHLGHRDRLRARFTDAGADALADYELLELVLFRTIPRRDVKPIAKALMGERHAFLDRRLGCERATAART